MKVIYDVLKINKKFINPVLAIGVFDGLHLGHRYLISKVIRRAKSIEGTSIVMTFFPHPSHVLSPKLNLPLLISLKERLNLIEVMGVDICLVVNFTRRFSKLDPYYFVKKYILKHVAPREVFIGHDFRFGRNREGDFNFLKKFSQTNNFKVYEIPAVKNKGLVVSSTLIRKFIAAGNLIKARQLLGRNIFVSGKVKRGDHRGRLLGFPTANMDVSSQVIVPLGVYIIRVIMNGKIYKGMANVGFRPSFEKEKKLTVEAHIFRFNQSIYGQMITIEFLNKIREEKRFKTKNDLISQLQKDKQQALLLFSKKFSSR